MVGASHITETRQDRIKDQIQVLEDHPQIWHTVTQNSGGSITNRKGNGDRFLAEGHKEAIKVKIAWEVRDNLDLTEVCKGKQLVGFTEIACHMVFDVKMDFTQKARFVAGGHLMDDLTTITYSSVVSRDSVRMVLTIAELIGLDVMCCDMGNAYVNAPCREKVWFFGGERGGGGARCW